MYICPSQFQSCFTRVWLALCVTNLVLLTVLFLLPVAKIFRRSFPSQILFLIIWMENIAFLFSLEQMQKSLQSNTFPFFHSGIRTSTVWSNSAVNSKIHGLLIIVLPVLLIFKMFKVNKAPFNLSLGCFLSPFCSMSTSL